METGAQRDERTERYPTVRNYSIIEKSRMIWNWIVDAVLRHALYSLSTGPLPRHIAFIMDGNRRWSRSHGMPVQEGHAKGFETLKRILELCLSLQRIEVVTVYAFAIDNFKRKASEVDALMELARTRLIELYQESEFVARHSIRIRIAGHREYLPPSVQETAGASRKRPAIIRALSSTSAFRTRLRQKYAMLHRKRPKLVSPSFPIQWLHI